MHLLQEKRMQLLSEAKKAMENAYAPYSCFRVGAALLTESGKIFSGCNIENASYSLTVCAERTAIFKAVSAGETKFTALAVVSSGKKLTPPCGACRQVMAEFGDFDVIMEDENGHVITMKVSELLPLSFSLK